MTNKNLSSDAAINPSKDFPIVGIGASAGGLESLERLFSDLPAEPGMAFVIVQHLSPDFKSMMDELLSRHSKIPVDTAEHEVAIQPNQVYLLPPRKEMTVKDRRLLLADKDTTRAMTLPIDLFFRSLANDAGPQAVAIVLSGSGSDGSRGIAEIKNRGGKVLAESGESAKFNGMPLSTLATGLVDFSGTPREIANYLLGLPAGDGEYGSVEPPLSDQTLSDQTLSELPIDGILHLLCNQYGLDFSLYKRTTVHRRIQRRMALLKIDSLGDYLGRLRADSTELGLLYHDLLIGVTCFFRDPEAFEIIEERVIPELLDRVPSSDEIRIWVAGCATGEEAYSLAIILFEQLTARDRPVNFKILATDVHRDALECGGMGIYSEDQLVNVSARRCDRFFSRLPNNRFQVSQDLRQRIVFAPHNISQDAPFTKMHLITCRNLLIYLNPEAQKTALSLFHFGLANSGILFLGSSESTGVFAQEFDTLDEHWKIYRKRRDVRLLDPLRLPVTGKTIGYKARQPNSGRSATTPEPPQLLALYDQLLDRFMPPGFLIDERHILVDSFNGAERYLRIGRRRPSSSIHELLQGDLRIAVTSALQRIFCGESNVCYEGIPLDSADSEGTAGETSYAAIAAEALTSSRTGGKHVLIIIEEQNNPIAAAGDTQVNSFTSSIDKAAEHSYEAMNSELAYTRESLQSAIEEQQTSNEELQAANEELVASNEELQSTNEELHSVNEELYTVNSEYQKKIVELRELNNDMQHLLEGTDIGILFLDRQLSIRKFTPRVASIFHIRTEDVGRNIQHFSHELKRPTLVAELKRVLCEGKTVEEEVCDREGTTYFLRIIPYRPASEINSSVNSEQAFSRNNHEQMEGIMLSLTDISALDHARARINQLSAIVESSDDAIFSKDLDGVITTWNRGATRLYGYSAEEIVGRNVRLLAPPSYQSQVDSFLKSVIQGERVEGVETMRAHKNGKFLDVSVTVSPIINRDKAITGASVIARDITQLKQTQRDLEEREARIRLLLDSTAEAIYGVDAQGVCIFCNPACIKMLGYNTPNDLIGQRIHPLIHHSYKDGTPYPEDKCPIYHVLKTGTEAYSDSEVLFRSDGSCFPTEYWSHAIHRNGSIEGAVVTFLDVTQRKKTEEELRIGAERREHFLAMLSHELRNPLSAVLNAAGLMQVKSQSAEAVQKARAVIERQSGHMARLLDDLLDVARISRGGIELYREDLDLHDPIQQAIESVEPLLSQKKISLQLELAKAPLPVRGDRARLQQIIGNLLTNAIKYSHEGSPVKLSAQIHGERIIITVRDRGFGISPELLPQIFELFVQNEQGLARSQGGLGVGLALVRQLVELHSGSVEAHSAGEGKGSEFRVILPRHTSRAFETENNETEFATKAGRIVIVEDQDDAREILQHLLMAKGYTVYEAKNGKEAIEVIEREQPDIALIDIGLPVLDGFAVAKRLRQNRSLDDVVLIALTGYGTANDIEAARSAGFNEHLTKPVDLQRIEKVLAHRG